MSLHIANMFYLTRERERERERERSTSVNPVGTQFKFQISRTVCEELVSCWHRHYFGTLKT